MRRTVPLGLVLALVLVGCSLQSPATTPAPVPVTASPSATPTAPPATAGPLSMPSTASVAVPLMPVPGGWRITPHPLLQGVQQGLPSSYWLRESGIALVSGELPPVLLNLKQGQTLNLDGVLVHDNLQAVAPDLSHAAMVRDGQLIIRNLSTGVEQAIEIPVDPATGAKLAIPMLSWAPNARYLIGTWGHTQFMPSGGPLWAVDMASNKLTTVINAAHLYHQPQWSPDGTEVIVAETLERHGDGSKYQWTLVSLKHLDARVVVPSEQLKLPTEYHFNMNSGGTVYDLTSYTHGGTRPTAYDPIAQRYSFGYTDSALSPTEVHLLDREGKPQQVIDLKPSLKQLFPIESAGGFQLVAFASPDGNSIILEGEVSKDGRTQRLFGYLSMSDRIPHLRLIDGGSGWLPIGFPRPRLDGGTGLLLGHSDHQLALFDTVTGRETVLVDGQSLLAAWWSHPGLVLYVSEQEAGYVTPEGKRVPFLTAPTGGKILGATLSPNRRYLAISHNGAGNSAASTLELLDLESAHYIAQKPLDKISYPVIIREQLSLTRLLATHTETGEQITINLSMPEEKRVAFDHRFAQGGLMGGTFLVVGNNKGLDAQGRATIELTDSWYLKVPGQP